MFRSYMYSMTHFHFYCLITSLFFVKLQHFQGLQGFTCSGEVNALADGICQLHKENTQKTQSIDSLVATSVNLSVHLSVQDSPSISVSPPLCSSVHPSISQPVSQLISHTLTHLIKSMQLYNNVIKNIYICFQLLLNFVSTKFSNNMVIKSKIIKSQVKN